MSALAALALAALASLAGALALASDESVADHLYVSPQGNDSWPGTLEQPFATIARAQRAVRERTTEPGSWYLDRSVPGRHILYYLARPGEDPRSLPRRIVIARNYWDDAQPYWWPEDTPTNGVVIAGNTPLPRAHPLSGCREQRACAAILDAAGPR